MLGRIPSMKGNF